MAVKLKGSFLRAWNDTHLEAGADALALGLRLLLLAYGEWQDRTMDVKYTDVDYYVFSDAASHVAAGRSPYERATFRYTPLLAWMLVPGVFLGPLYGKLVFILFDMLTGVLTRHTLHALGCSRRTALLASLLWLLNPLPMAVSSRGNAEPLMTCLVLLSLQLLIARHTALAGTVFALAVHVKIYPITYAVPIYIFLGSHYTDPKRTAVTYTDVLAVMKDLRPNRQRFVFMLTGFAVLASLTSVFYARYGWPFLYESYLYHVVRQDTRHNFSPYFYLLYLSSHPQSPAPPHLSLLLFLPQALLLLFLALRLHHHLPAALFLQTLAFVALNKVCTSQYFLWYLGLLPLVVPWLQVSWRQAAVLLALWFAGQMLWLLPAYCLEFQGANSFLAIWLAGLVFLATKLFIMHFVITHCQRLHTFHNKKD